MKKNYVAPELTVDSFVADTMIASSCSAASRNSLITDVYEMACSEMCDSSTVMGSGCAWDHDDTESGNKTTEGVCQMYAENCYYETGLLG